MGALFPSATHLRAMAKVHVRDEATSLYTWLGDRENTQGVVVADLECQHNKQGEEDKGTLFYAPWPWDSEVVARSGTW
jgi:hypothetical protein